MHKKFKSYEIRKVLTAEEVAKLKQDSRRFIAVDDFADWLGYEDWMESFEDEETINDIISDLYSEAADDLADIKRSLLNEYRGLTYSSLSPSYDEVEKKVDNLLTAAKFNLTEEDKKLFICNVYNEI